MEDTTIDAQFLISSTAAALQKCLGDGKFSSVSLVAECYLQIERHEPYLHAVISPAPLQQAIEFARRLDEERASGIIRSPIHGLPVLLKDNIATDPSLGMETTAGTLSLAGSRPKRSAKIVQRIIDAGGIIIAKANLSELSWFKSASAPSGWSPVGGQTQSAFVRGGFRADDTGCGHSNPGGSSSGSAVGVSAGYAPVSIGTETNGSLILPANRAALYALKPTVGTVSTDGLVPISKPCDSPGPMAKCAGDIAILMDILVDPMTSDIPQGGYQATASASWEGLRIGTLDHTAAKFPEEIRKREPTAEEQMRVEAQAAYAKIRDLASTVVENIPFISPENHDNSRDNVMANIFNATFRQELEEYLANLESTNVRTLGEIVQFNKDHADRALPPNYSGQELLEDALKSSMPSSELAGLIATMRNLSRDEGIDKLFRRHDLNILLGPAESQLPTMAAAAGYPIASLPLGFLKFNGRPHGLAAIAQAHNEGLLIQLMSAWESMFSTPRSMSQLLGLSGEK